MTVKDGTVNISAAGHDYELTEPENLSYHWELVADVMHPMFINGTLTMLVKVTDEDELAAIPSSVTETKTDGTYYKIGDNYYKKSDSTDGALSAANYRRASLNLKKVVTGSAAPEGSEFKFSMKLTAPANAKPADKEFWFAVQDADGEFVKDLTVENATPEDGNTGYYYFNSGETVSVVLKDGWNLRFTNVLTGTEYEFEEINLPANYALEGDTAITVTPKEDKPKNDAVISGNKISGKLIKVNVAYQVTYTNTYEMTNVIVEKTFSGITKEQIPADFAVTASFKVPEGSDAIADKSLKITDKDVKVSEDGLTYTWTIGDLPKGTEVTATETGTAVAGYSPLDTAVTSGKATTTIAEDVKIPLSNPYEKDLGDLKITKTISGLPEGEVPADLKFTVTGPEDYEEVVEFSEFTNGEYLIEDLPVGEYTVVESGTDYTDYTITTAEADQTKTAEVKKNETATAAFTNTYEQDRGTLEIKKTINGLPEGAVPEKLSFTVTDADGNEVATLSYADLSDKEKNPIDLPVGEYTVKESGTDYPDYTLDKTGSTQTATANVKKNEKATAELINKYIQDTGSLKITKSLTGLPEGTAPEELKFTVTGPEDYKKEVLFSEFKDGEYLIEGLPVGAYTVTESDTDYTDYTLDENTVVTVEVKITKDNTAVAAFINAYTQDKGFLKVTKTIKGLPEGKVPADLTFSVKFSDGTEVAVLKYAELSDTEKNPIELPVGEYTVTESGTDYDYYTLDRQNSTVEAVAKVTKGETAEAALTNVYTADTATLKLTKTAEGLVGTDKVPDDAKFVISGKLLSGEKFEDIELTYADIKDSKWSETVPVGTYTVKESGADVTGYELKTEYSKGVQLAKGEEKSLSVTNTYTRKKIEITVTKVWKDEENKYGVRPESVKFTVTGSDKVTYDVTLKGTGDTWTEKLSVPEYTNGEKNTYTVDEEKVTAGYTKEVKDLTITNTFKPCWGDPPVKKVLEGDKPAKAETFKFKLTAVSTTAEGLSGKMPMPEAAKGAQEMTMDVAAGETKEFGKFDLVKPGVYTYTITEVAGDKEGYTYSTEKHTIVYTVTANEETNSLECVKTVDGVEIDAEKETAEENVSKFTFTNEYKKPVVSVKVSKVWEDNNNEELTRPDSIKVKLLADGKDTGKTIELSKDTEWAGIFEDLDKYDADGKEIKYTVDEAEVPEGYSAVVSGDATKGFVITNSVVPPTGDTSDIFFWSGLSMTSLLGLGYLFLKRRKEDQ
jgi:pilin isopeptide linkage protein/LPXTG-motif cell wall-anchored protein